MRTRRECSQKHTNLVETHIYIQQSRLDQALCLHLVEICAIITQYPTGSRRVMYDDYDLDYSGNDYGQDLDEYTQELDEDYVRDSTNYETLAYRHYA